MARGGARNGAGRRAEVETKVVKATIGLTQMLWEYVEQQGEGNYSAGLRKIVTEHMTGPAPADLQSTAKSRRTRTVLQEVREQHPQGWQEDGTYRINGRVIRPPMTAEEFVKDYVKEHDLPAIGRIGRDAKIERDHYPDYLQTYYARHKIPECDWL